mgnify:CR=1 FL=1
MYVLIAKNHRRRRIATSLIEQSFKVTLGWLFDALFVGARLVRTREGGGGRVRDAAQRCADRAASVN